MTIVSTVVLMLSNQLVWTVVPHSCPPGVYGVPWLDMLFTLLLPAIVIWIRISFNVFMKILDPHLLVAFAASDVMITSVSIAPIVVAMAIKFIA